jgi:hypothetical protein
MLVLAVTVRRKSANAEYFSLFGNSTALGNLGGLTQNRE